MFYVMFTFCFLVFFYLMRDSFRCSLGEVTNNDDHYKKALEVSNNKSARAMVKLMLILFSSLIILFATDHCIHELD
jgi:hypothetical protein